MSSFTTRRAPECRWCSKILWICWTPKIEEMIQFDVCMFFIRFKCFKKQQATGTIDCSKIQLALGDLGWFGYISKFWGSSKSSWNDHVGNHWVFSGTSFCLRHLYDFHLPWFTRSLLTLFRHICQLFKRMEGIIFVSLTPPKVSSEIGVLLKSWPIFRMASKQKMLHMGMPYRENGGVMKFVYVYLVSCNFIMFLDAKLQLHKLCVCVRESWRRITFELQGVTLS